MLQIKATDCVKLEQDKVFKKKYLKNVRWWKSILIVPPTLLLFLGVFGFLYLMGYDLLTSYYVIPFAVVFLIGTIWFKAVKRHLQNAILSYADGYRVCIAIPVCSSEGYTYFASMDKEKRHNEHFIRQFTLSLSPDDIVVLMKGYKKRPVYQYDKLSDTKYFLISYLTRNIEKQNALWKGNEALPLLCIDKDNVCIIKGSDIVSK